MRRTLTLRALILTLFALVAAGDVLLQPSLGVDADGFALVHHARVVAVAAALDDDRHQHPGIGEDAPLVPGAAPLPLPRDAALTLRPALGASPVDRARPPPCSRGPPRQASAACTA